MSSSPTTAREQFNCDRDLGFLDTSNPIFAETVTANSPRDFIEDFDLPAVVIDAADSGRNNTFDIWFSAACDVGIPEPRRGMTFTLASGLVITLQGFETDEGMHHGIAIAAQEGA